MKKEPKGKKLDSIKELNESQQETPKKTDGRNVDAEKSDSKPPAPAEKKTEATPIKDEQTEKHKQQGDGSKAKAAGDDSTTKQEEETKREKREVSGPLKLQRNEVKAPEDERRTGSR